jgi:hypothetical protein
VPESTANGHSRQPRPSDSSREFSFRPPPLPTPTPTTASVFSDEDVAIQLMRLTDPLATPLLSPSVVDEAEAEKDHSIPDTEKKTDSVEDPCKEEPQHSRCARCIHSKKGCDRKRPCSRCVQSGYEDWECTSDDERGTAQKRIAAIRRTSAIGRSTPARSVSRPRKSH